MVTGRRRSPTRLAPYTARIGPRRWAIAAIFLPLRSTISRGHSELSCQLTRERQDPVVESNSGVKLATMESRIVGSWERLGCLGCVLIPSARTPGTTATCGAE